VRHRRDAPLGQSHQRGTDRASINPRSATTVVFELCSNAILAAWQLAQLLDRCCTTSKPDRLAAQSRVIVARGIGLTSPSRALSARQSKRGTRRKFDLPKGGCFDASAIAPNVPTRKPQVAPSTQCHNPHDHMRGW
jgi:hypothetical protein